MWKVSARVWPNSKGASGSEKVVLLALAEMSDEHGVCWPSYETLAGMADINSRSVMRHVKTLAEKGYIYLVEQSGQNGGRGYTNVYFVTCGLTEQKISETLHNHKKLNLSDTRAKTEAKQLLVLQNEAKKGDGNDTLNADEKGDTDDTQTPEMQKRVTDLAEKGDTSVTRTDQEPVNLKTSPNGEAATNPPQPKNKSSLDDWFDEKGNPTSKHPAIMVFRSEMHRYPRKNQYSDIAEQVGVEPGEVEFWRQVINGWKLSPYAPTNIGGMLECFKKREIPTTKPNGANYGQGRANQSKPTPTEPEEGTWAARRAAKLRAAGTT